MQLQRTYFDVADSNNTAHKNGGNTISLKYEEVRR